MHELDDLLEIMASLAVVDHDRFVKDRNPKSLKYTIDQDGYFMFMPQHERQFKTGLLYWKNDGTWNFHGYWFPCYDDTDASIMLYQTTSERILELAKSSYSTNIIEDEDVVLFTNITIKQETLNFVKSMINL